MCAYFIGNQNCNHTITITNNTKNATTSVTTGRSKSIMTSYKTNNTSFFAQMQRKADKSSATTGNILYNLTNEDRNDGDAKVETTLSTLVTNLLIRRSQTTVTPVTPSPTSHLVETTRELEIPIIDLTSELFDTNQNIDGLEDNLSRIIEVVCVTAKQADKLVAKGGIFEIWVFYGTKYIYRKFFTFLLQNIRGLEVSSQVYY